MLLRLLILSLLIAAPAAGQFSESQSYKFLQAVRDAKNDDVVNMLDTPGQTVINARDISTGEGALHIVIKRGDGVYLRYLLAKGADPNLRDARGNTPLLVAVQYGQGELIDALIGAHANVNLPNTSGETPLIRAVQKRDLALTRSLLAAKANPDQTDNIAGMSARDYAHADDRSPAIAKLIDEAPKSSTRGVAGPKS